jgi:hypothetical protein
MDLEECPSSFQAEKHVEVPDEEEPAGTDEEKKHEDEEEKKIKIRTIKTAPTRRKIEEWIKVKGNRSIDEFSIEKQDIHEKTIYRDFDEEEEGIHNKSQIVLRVRRDSGDSVGSEISCSPPSSPESELRGKLELEVYRKNDVIYVFALSRRDSYHPQTIFGASSSPKLDGKRRVSQ